MLVKAAGSQPPPRPTGSLPHVPNEPASTLAILSQLFSGLRGSVTTQESIRNHSTERHRVERLWGTYGRLLSPALRHPFTLFAWGWTRHLLLVEALLTWIRSLDHTYTFLPSIWYHVPLVSPHRATP